MIGRTSSANPGPSGRALFAGASRRLVQLGSLMAVGLAFLFVPLGIDDDGVKRVAPFLIGVIYLQLAPVIWARRSDVFSPPALTGFIAALTSLSTLAGFLIAGEIQLDLVHGLDRQELTELAVRCLTATLLGLACYYVGYYLRAGVGFKRIFPRVAGFVWDRKRMIFVSVGCLAAFGAVYVAYRARLAGASLDTVGFGGGKQLLREDRNLTWIVRGLQLGFVPALFFVTWALRQKGRLAVVGSVVVLVGVSFVVSRSGWRGMFMNVLLIVLMLVHYLRRRIPAWGFALVLFGGIVTSNLLYAYRTQFEYRGVGDSSVSTQVRSPLVALAQFDAERQKLSVLALVMHEFPDRQPYLLGQSWLGVLAAPIPRWVWPQKAERFPWRDTQIVNQLGGGPFPTPYLGVLYVNFGWLGIVLGMLLWGILHRALYEWLLDHPTDVNVVLMYALMVLFFGLTLTQVDGMLQYVLPVWLLLHVVRKRGVDPPGAAEPAGA